MKKTLIKKNSRFLLKKYLIQFGSKNIFVITGKKSFKISGAKEYVIKELRDYNLSFFSNFSTNPKFSDAIKGTKKCIKNNCDTIIAIGGGSVIDMAKLINAFIFNEGKEEELAKGKIKVSSNSLNLIAIPTTSGTGSEETHFAVVYINNIKYSLASKKILPRLSIVDPFFTRNLDSYNKASAAFDALSQSVESFWNVYATEKSKKYAARSIELILKNIKDYMITSSEHSRFEMSKGSNFSGKAINITKTTAPHAISYPITTYCNVPHGHAVAISLGKFFIINSALKKHYIRNPEINFDLNKRMRDLFKLFSCKSAEECEKFWYKLMADVGLETNSKKLGIKKNSVLKLIKENINYERLKNNPVIINNKIIDELF